MYGEIKAGDKSWHVIPFPIGPDNSNLVRAGWLNLSVGGSSVETRIHVLVAHTGDTLRGLDYQKLHDEVYILTNGCRLSRQLEANADSVQMQVLDGDGNIGWTLELQAK